MCRGREIRSGPCSERILLRPCPFAGRGFLYANGEGQPPYDPDYDTIRTGQGYATLTKLTWDMRLNADDAELGKIDL